MECSNETMNTNYTTTSSTPLSQSPSSSPSSPPPPLPPTPTPNPPVVISPCAACKILRRRCAEKCVLAPYFPPTEPAKFTIAHRVFGASNIIKFLQVLFFMYQTCSTICQSRSMTVCSGILDTQ